MHRYFTDFIELRHLSPPGNYYILRWFRQTPSSRRNILNPPLFPQDTSSTSPSLPTRTSSKQWPKSTPTTARRTILSSWLLSPVSPARLLSSLPSNLYPWRLSKRACWTSKEPPAVPIPTAPEPEPELQVIVLDRESKNLVDIPVGDDIVLLFALYGGMLIGVFGLRKRWTQSFAAETAWLVTRNLLEMWS